MDKKEFLKILAIFSFIAILFSPMGSKIGIWFLIFGLIFGAFWFFKK